MPELRKKSVRALSSTSRINFYRLSLVFEALSSISQENITHNFLSVFCTKILQHRKTFETYIELINWLLFQYIYVENC